MTWLKQYKWLIIAVILAFIVRLVLIHFNPRHTFLENTGIEYLADSLADGRGYGYNTHTVDEASAYRPFWGYPPGTASLLAFMYILFDFGPAGFVYVRILQAFIDSFGCILIYLICKELFNSRVGIISAFIYTVFLPIAFMSTWVAHDALMPFLTLAALLCFIKGIKTNKWWYFTPSGVAIGTSCYFQPTTILLPFMFGVGYLVYSIYKSNLKVVMVDSIKYTLIMFTVMVIVIAPWMVRNSLLTGTFTPMRSCMWLTIYCGFAEFGENPESIVLDDLQELDKASVELGHRLIWASKEYEDYYRTKVIEFTKEHSTFVIKTIVKRIPWAVIYRPEMGLSNYQEDPEYGTAIADGIPSERYQAEYPQLLQLFNMAKSGKIIDYIKTYPKGAVITSITLLFIILPILLATLGIWAYRKKWRTLVLISTIPIYYSILSIFIITINAKNKVPGYDGYIILSALGIYYLFCKISRKPIDK